MWGRWPAVCLRSTGRQCHPRLQGQEHEPELRGSPAVCPVPREDTQAWGSRKGPATRFAALRPFLGAKRAWRRPQAQSPNPSGGQREARASGRTELRGSSAPQTLPPKVGESHPCLGPRGLQKQVGTLQTLAERGRARPGMHRLCLLPRFTDEETELQWVSDLLLAQGEQNEHPGAPDLVQTCQEAPFPGDATAADVGRWPGPPRPLRPPDHCQRSAIPPPLPALQTLAEW